MFWGLGGFCAFVRLLHNVTTHQEIIQYLLSRTHTRKKRRNVDEWGYSRELKGWLVAIPFKNRGKKHIVFSSLSLALYLKVQEVSVVCTVLQDTKAVSSKWY